MPDIKVLPSNIANMIAAGEVVQRPASVVKELMENAVDAGATQVSVVIRDAGRTLIQVIDNGCGMSPSQAVLAFERHATSKIATADDLMDISTFGFRGEALASIAAVAEVTLKTRRAEDELGVQVDFADSQLVSTSPTATPVGSNFAVRNLFYNVPARRKFLKSESVELKHIVTEFQRVAYTRPDIAFTLLHNDKEIYVLKVAKSLKFRIQDIAGANIASETVDMGVETSLVNITGFIGRPDKARKGLGNQMFFVNGRYFRSPYLHKAVMKGYERLIPEGTTPTYFIYLDIDPHNIDVNIHPTKTEIKFEDDSLVFQTLYACVRETLGKSSFGTAIDFEGLSDAPQMPSLGKNFGEYKGVSEPVYVDSGYNPFDNDGFEEGAPSPLSVRGVLGGDAQRGGFSLGAEGGFGGAAQNGFSVGGTQGWSDGGFAAGAQGGNQPGSQGGYNGSSQGGYNGGSQSGYIPQTQDYGKLFEDSFSLTRGFLTVHDKYIVTLSKSGLMVINAKRAMERILYDRFLTASGAQAPSSLSQALLFPVSVRVGAENVPIFESNVTLLSKYGFDLTPIGVDTVAVNAVPAGYPSGEESVRTMVADMLLLLQDSHSSLQEVMNSDLSQKFALLGAANYEGVHNAEQAQRLVSALLSSTNPEYTAGGRKTMIIISSDDLDKKF